MLKCVLDAVLVDVGGDVLGNLLQLGSADGIVVEGGAASSDVAILGTFSGIVRAKASGTIAVGDKVVVDSAGKVKALPATAGTYTIVGVALQAGATDELVEIAPWQPVSATVS